jgi:hypothetical protein
MSASDHDAAVAYLKVASPVPHDSRGYVCDAFLAGCKHGRSAGVSDGAVESPELPEVYFPVFHDTKGWGVWEGNQRLKGGLTEAAAYDLAHALNTARRDRQKLSKRDVMEAKT